MARVSSRQSLDSILEAAIRPVVARLSRDIAKALDAAAPKRAPGSALRGARTTGRRSRRPVEMTKWVADRNARRVPIFVIEMTGGLDTKKKIVAKYGENARFEKGKPLPKEAAGASVRATGKDAARTVKAKPPVVRRSSPSTPSAAG